MQEYQVTFGPVKINASNEVEAIEKAILELRILKQQEKLADVEVSDTHILRIVFDDGHDGLYTNALDRTPAQIEEAGGSLDLYKTLLEYHGEAFMEEHGFDIINDSTLYTTPFEKLINPNWMMNYFYGDEEEE